MESRDSLHKRVCQSVRKVGLRLRGLVRLVRLGKKLKGDHKTWAHGSLYREPILHLYTLSCVHDRQGLTPDPCPPIRCAVKIEAHPLLCTWMIVMIRPGPPTEPQPFQRDAVIKIRFGRRDGHRVEESGSQHGIPIVSPRLLRMEYVGSHASSTRTFQMDRGSPRQCGENILVLSTGLSSGCSPEAGGRGEVGGGTQRQSRDHTQAL